MKYKTITLELLQTQPNLYEQLRSSKKLLEAMDTYAGELKASHDNWTQTLGLKQPGGDPIQTAAQALELAIKELRNRLASASATASATEPLSLDAAMSFIRRHTQAG